MSTADEALTDCQAVIRTSIIHLQLADGVLETFVEKFRADFEQAFASNPRAWVRDRPKVTTLARSIGTFAEFAALSDPALPKQVQYGHLKFAYELLAPFCRPEGIVVRRQYCTTAQP